MQLAAEMLPDFVQHPGKIENAIGHFLRTLGKLSAHRGFIIDGRDVFVMSTGLRRGIAEIRNPNVETRNKHEVPMFKNQNEAAAT